MDIIGIAAVMSAIAGTVTMLLTLYDRFRPSLRRRRSRMDTERPLTRRLGKVATKIVKSLLIALFAFSATIFADRVGLDAAINNLLRNSPETERRPENAIAITVGIDDHVAIAEQEEQRDSSEMWRGLEVAAESRCSHYDPRDYKYGLSIEPVIAARDQGKSRYDETITFDDLSQSDIDHVVAISEAHDSGLCGETDLVRFLFANDRDNMVLATPQLNRNEKRGRDAAEWLPKSNRCWFANTIIDVRKKYKLTIDRNEADVLDAVLEECEE